MGSFVLTSHSLLGKLALECSPRYIVAVLPKLPHVAKRGENMGRTRCMDFWCSVGIVVCVIDSSSISLLLLRRRVQISLGKLRLSNRDSLVDLDFVESDREQNVGHDCNHAILEMCNVGSCVSHVVREFDGDLYCNFAVLHGEPFGSQR